MLERSLSTVLVIDDEEGILASVRRLLRREFDVVTARSAAEGLALLATKDVHVIMSDQRMPDMTGSEVLARARSDYPDAIRMLLTGYADLENVIAAINSGQIFRYLIKPWNPDELLATVREAAEKHWLIVQNRNLYAVLAAARDELEQRVEERTRELTAANARLLELQAMLREQAIRDPLTGLFNRRYFDETLPREMARAKRANVPFGVLVVDLDHFKQINDTFGHAAGDAVLQAVADVLQRCVRAEDLVCRYGGEEFVLMLGGMEISVLEARAEQIRMRIRALEVPVSHRLIQHLTISMGIATAPIHGDGPTELFAAADTALYRAKQHGRDRVELAETARSLAVEQDIPTHDLLNSAGSSAGVSLVLGKSHPP